MLKRKSAQEKLEDFNKNLVADYRRYQELQKTCTTLEEKIVTCNVLGKSTSGVMIELAERQHELAAYKAKIETLSRSKSTMIQVVQEEEVGRIKHLRDEHNKKLATIDNEIVELDKQILRLRNHRIALDQESPINPSNVGARSYVVTSEELESTLLGSDMAVNPLEVAGLADTATKAAAEELHGINVNRIRHGAPSQSLQGYVIRCDARGNLIGIESSFGG